MLAKLINRSTQAFANAYNKMIFDHALCTLCGSALKSVDSKISVKTYPVLTRPLTVCPNCFRWLTPIRMPCVQCAIPTTYAGTLCGRCINRPPAYDQVVAGCLYQGPIQSLALQQKQGKRAALKPLLYALEQRLAPIWSRPLIDPHLFINSSNPTNTSNLVNASDLVNASNPLMLFPIPTPWNRWLIRGFNPTHEIAWQLTKGVLTQWSIPHHIAWRALQATPHPPQKQQTYAQRLRLAKQLFGWQQPQNLSGKHCVLIDDVMTTGATLTACATLLKQQGAAQVDAWVLCRTPRKATH
jgi:ComF family protein